ncbi:MAG: ribonuclease III [Opitutaceae bacterium]
MSPEPTALETRIAHVFRDRSLLERALTHPSLLPVLRGAESNQRLEFLGDAVLQLLLSEALYAEFPGEREGLLSRRRATLANGTTLALLARELGLDQALRLGSSEEASGGRQRTSALGDAFEALLGAVYLDAGLEAARTVARAAYGPLPARLAALGDDKTPKSRLQEWVQPKHGNDALAYAVIATEGEDHRRTFEVSVSLLGREIGRGRGPSKKAAEEAAAEAALREMPS